MNMILKALFGSAKHKAPRFRARLSVQDLEGRQMMDAALMAELSRPIESSMAQVRNFDQTAPAKSENLVLDAVGSNVTPHLSTRIDAFAIL